jgi:hypothetical protein
MGGLLRVCPLEVPMLDDGRGKGGEHHEETAFRYLSVRRDPIHRAALVSPQERRTSGCGDVASKRERCSHRSSDPCALASEKKHGDARVLKLVRDRDKIFVPHLNSVSG